MAKLNDLINKMKMIIKTTLTVNGYKATLKPKLQLYQEDIVFIEFTLINSVISSINGVEVEESLPLSAKIRLNKFS